MDNKELLFGLKNVNKTVYNTLYVLCIVFMMVVAESYLFSFFIRLNNVEFINELEWYYIFITIFITGFTFSFMFDKKHFA